MSDLNTIAVGQSAKVSSVLGNDGVSVRLMEMGLVPGVEVKMLGSAPLGDPLELELRGYRLSLRRTEAARVEIE